MLLWDTDLSAFGSTGNVVYGPSWIDRLPGGLPRALAFDAVALVQAEDTAGPCFLRDRARDDPGVIADMGSSYAGKPGALGSSADIGWGVVAVSWEPLVCQ